MPASCSSVPMDEALISDVDTARPHRARFAFPVVSARSALAVTVLGVVLGYAAVLLAWNADLAARTVLLRYWAFGAMGAFAVLTPHVLLPDPHRPTLARLNRPPRALLTHQLRRLAPLGGLLLGLGLLLALADGSAPLADLGAKLRPFGELGLVVLGTGGVALARYGAIGPLSQAWQEGTQGGWYRAVRDETGYAFAVPEGMVPAMLATQRVFLTGVVGLLASLYLSRLAPAWSLLPGAVLVAWAAVQLTRRLARYDYAFYATHAFYREVFTSGGVQAAKREPVPYRSLYWVPVRWRPAVWAGIRQLDRRLPLGRFVAFGYAILALLAWRGADPSHLYVVLAGLVGAQNGVTALLTTPALGPLPFGLGRHSTAHWVGTRFFVSARWALPMALGLGTLAALSDAVSFLAAGAWVLIDLVVAFFTAALLTYAHEGRYRRRFA